jgi:hypothetical protein
MDLSAVATSNLYIQTVARGGVVLPPQRVPPLGDALETPAAADRYEPSSSRESLPAVTYGPRRSVYT